MKNFLKTFGVILIILGSYLFVINVLNKGGYQIFIGAATGSIGYIFFKSSKNFKWKNHPI